MGGFMGTPPAPAQPPQVNFTTTAESRGGFSNFLKSIPSTTAMTPIPPMGSSPMPPMGGNPMANIDIFNQPPTNSVMQPPMMMADGGVAGSPLSSYGDYLSQTIENTQVQPFIQEVQEMASDRFNLDQSQSGGMNANPFQAYVGSPLALSNLSSSPSQSIGQGQNQFGSVTGNFNDPNRINQSSSGYNNQSLNDLFSTFSTTRDAPTQGQAIFNNPVMENRVRTAVPSVQPSTIGQRPMPGQSPMGGFGSDRGILSSLGSLGGLRGFAEGGNVPPRRTEIMGQDHMLSYITPEEGGILKALGGAGKPGPMGIPSYYDDSDFGGFSDYSSVDAPSDYSDFSGDNTFSDNTDYSDPDQDMDYTDVDYGYTTQDTDTGKDDMDRASEIGQAVAQAQAAANEIQNRALAAQNKANINQAINQNKANQQSLIDTQLSLAPSKSGTTTTGKTSGSMPGGPPTSNVQAAANTNFSNIGAKGDDDPLGLSLQGVGLGPSINTPSIASVSPTSGPNTNADITGFGSSRDKSDFSTDIDALADVEEQAKKGSFPNLDKVPGTLGVVTGLINAATKRGAQNTIDNISKGFTPTYDKEGSITGTTNYGIGMGQPGGLFGSGTTVDGYDVFDKTSPSLGMYDDNEIGGDESDNPLILRKPIAKPIEEEDDGDKPPNVIGGGDPITPPASGPVVVDSPYTSNVGDYTPVGFDAGDLNALIAQLTGVAAPQFMKQGGVAGYAEGGLINAVDNFLASV
jgi:hypothetical protein